MSDRFKGASTDKLRDLVQQILAERSIRRRVSVDDVLPDVGVTSLDLVKLMLTVEAEFGVTIPDSEMKPSTFRSIATINALVLALLADERRPSALAQTTLA